MTKAIAAVIAKTVCVCNAIAQGRTHTFFLSVELFVREHGTQPEQKTLKVQRRVLC
jgi:hypothetical protein